MNIRQRYVWSKDPDPERPAIAFDLSDQDLKIGILTALLPNVGDVINSPENRVRGRIVEREFTYMKNHIFSYRDLEIDIKFTMEPVREVH